MTTDDNLAAVLVEATQTPDGGDKLFTSADVERIMRGKGTMKEELQKQTEKAVELGAFGAPWLWVTNAQGEKEAFFGSDR